VGRRFSVVNLRGAPGARSYIAVKLLTAHSTKTKYKQVRATMTPILLMGVTLLKASVAAKR